MVMKQDQSNWVTSVVVSQDKVSEMLANQSSKLIQLNHTTPRMLRPQIWSQGFRFTLLCGWGLAEKAFFIAPRTNLLISLCALIKPCLFPPPPC